MTFLGIMNSDISICNSNFLLYVLVYGLTPNFCVWKMGSLVWEMWDQVDIFLAPEILRHCYVPIMRVKKCTDNSFHQLFQSQSSLTFSLWLYLKPIQVINNTRQTKQHQTRGSKILLFPTPGPFLIKGPETQHMEYLSLPVGVKFYRRVYTLNPST